MSRRRRLLVTTAVTLALGLLAAELLMRWRFRDSLVDAASAGEAGSIYFHARMLEPVESGGLPYRGRPHARVEVFGIEYRHNALGLRGEEIDVAKAPGVFRVLVLGDSNAYGWGVAEDEVFPRRLEEIWNAGPSARRIEVVNAGLPGYCTRDERALFLRLQPLLRPDLVLVAFFGNDLERFGFHIAPEGALVVDPLPIPNVLKPWLWHSTLYRYVATRAFERMRASGAYVPCEGRNREAGIEALRALAGDAQNAGVPLVFADVPVLEPDAGRTLRDPVGSTGASYSAALAGVARAAGVPLVDLRDCVAREPVGALWYSPERGDHHPNAKAHAFFAEALAAFLRDRGLVPPQ